MINYKIIKETAKRKGLKISDLLALSPGCDSFYVGSPGQMSKAHWGAEIYQDMGSPEECHVRRIHYWAVSQDPKILKPNGEEYLNTVSDWGFLNSALKYARYAGLIPVENFIDRRNPAPIVNAHLWADECPSETVDGLDVSELLKMLTNRVLCFNPQNTQAYSLEIFCEKSTMNDVLEPICKKFGINLVTGLGELSITAVRLLVEERIVNAEKPAIIFYISDFDPAGECMPVSVARKIEYFICVSDIPHNVKLKPIMLTQDQCERYQLPRTPIKETERRRDSFEKRYGQGATELDALGALHPGELAELVTSEILQYFDVHAWNSAQRMNSKLRDHVYNHLAEKSEVIHDLIDALKKIDLSEFDEYTPARGSFVDDTDQVWLYDSARGYGEQIVAYKQHKSGDNHE